MHGLALTDEEHVREADALILAYVNSQRAYASEANRKRNKPIHFKIVREYGPIFKDDLEQLREGIKYFLGRLPYRYARFASENLGMAAVAVVAFPPDLTWRTAGPLVKPWTWITWSFFTYQKHRPIIARYFTGLSRLRYIQFRRNPGLLAAPLRRVYESHASRYIERGYKESRARLLAWRDVNRILLGCTWLVATLEALNMGYIKPKDVVLPGILEDHPEAARRLINPGDVDPTWSKYTWEALVRRVSKRA